MDPEPAGTHLTVVPTRDGSATLLHGELNQTYHSVNGALQEARHVFLQQGLIYFQQQNHARAARVLEIGFGTGLNFIVSAAHCLENGLELYYTGIEPFPVPSALLRKSKYCELLPGQENPGAFLNWYPGARTLQLPGDSPLVQLQLITRKVQESGPLSPADVVYFDAFAPSTQPEMWTTEVISHVTGSLSAGGVFVSYSITGNLKRMLKQLNFRIEKPAGAAGKREMIRAVKNR